MPAPARIAALQALRLVETADLGDTLARARDPLTDPRDRALATDLITGTLRWRGAIDYQLARISGRPLSQLDADVLTALRLGAYQLLYLERVPISAIVNDSVELVKGARLKSAAPFVNAVLRRLARERGALVWPPREQLVEFLSAHHSHPAWLVERWIQRLGPATTEEWLTFNNEPAALTLATNRLMTDREALIAELTSEGIQNTATRIAPHGVKVLEGKALASAPFRRGACLVQDEASQIIPELVAGRAGERVLDACAAPGGKTVALAAQVTARGLVVATDVRSRRMRVLAATLGRCRVANAHLVHIGKTAPLSFAEGCFDRVLVDAPCSGLGTLRRDPDIKWKRSAADLERFAAAQVDLLRRVAPVVAAGGRVVYATCSSEPEENEWVVRTFLEQMPAFAVRPLSALDDVAPAIRALSTPEGYLRTDPARDGLEAFFGAVLEKPR